MENLEKMSREIRDIKEDVKEIKLMLENSDIGSTRHEEYTPTSEENRLLEEARREIRNGEGMTEDQLKKDMET